MAALCKAGRWSKSLIKAWLICIKASVGYFDCFHACSAVTQQACNCQPWASWAKAYELPAPTEDSLGQVTWLALSAWHRQVRCGAWLLFSRSSWNNIWQRCSWLAQLLIARQIHRQKCDHLATSNVCAHTLLQGWSADLNITGSCIWTTDHIHCFCWCWPTGRVPTN